MKNVRKKKKKKDLKKEKKMNLYGNREGPPVHPSSCLLGFVCAVCALLMRRVDS